MIPAEELRRIFAEHRQVVELVRDLEAGVVHLTLDEYQERLPAVLRDVWMMYKTIRAEAQRVQNIHP